MEDKEDKREKNAKRIKEKKRQEVFQPVSFSPSPCPPAGGSFNLLAKKLKWFYRLHTRCNI